MAEAGVALIGYAFMGRAHSNAWRQVTPFLAPRVTPRLRVIAGRTRAAVDVAARRLGWESADDDWRRAIERPDVQIVDICTPGDSHAEIAIAAAQAGKAVICEKPLANTVAEAESMLAAATSSGIIHMVCHNYRRVPAILLARSIIADGMLGEIRHFRGAYLQDWITDPEFPLVWRLRKERAGSGALGDIGSHAIDLARFLVGEVSEVCGMLETFVRGRPLPDAPEQRGAVTVDDACIALLRFANGAIGSMEATRMAPGRRNHNTLEINGSRGSLRFDLERLNELELYLEEGDRALRGFRTINVTDPEHPFMKHWWPPGHLIGYEHTFTHTMYDFLESYADGRVPSPSFADGLANQRVMAAIEESARARAWVGVG